MIDVNDKRRHLLRIGNTGKAVNSQDTYADHRVGKPLAVVQKLCQAKVSQLERSISGQQDCSMGHVDRLGNR
jgi:hypothetical protein